MRFEFNEIVIQHYLRRMTINGSVIAHFVDVKMVGTREKVRATIRIGVDPLLPELHNMSRLAFINYLRARVLSDQVRASLNYEIDFDFEIVWKPRPLRTSVSSVVYDMRTRRRR